MFGKELQKNSEQALNEAVDAFAQILVALIDDIEEAKKEKDIEPFSEEIKN